MDRLALLQGNADTFVDIVRLIGEYEGTSFPRMHLLDNMHLLTLR